MTDKEFLKHLGLKLKCHRIMTDLSVKQVAEKTGIHEATINKMEKGANDFHILTLKRIATVYGIELKEVF
jgi:DNA-binding XRE family transcriptional regulator